MINESMPVFSGHNFQLDDGRWTNGLAGDEHGRAVATAWNNAVARTLDVVFPNKQGKSIIDLGCLEGGYSVRFARMGFDTVGLEIRSQNIECCNYAKNHTNLPNLKFVQDNVLNMQQYGKFDVVFCCGLLYHLDNPREMVTKMAQQANKMLILQTHFCNDDEPNLEYNEGLPGKWMPEFNETDDVESLRWASYHNHSSFWVQRKALIGLIKSVGFDIVYEQFDCFLDLDVYLEKNYHLESRGTFIGIRI